MVIEFKKIGGNKKKKGSLGFANESLVSYLISVDNELVISYVIFF